MSTPTKYPAAPRSTETPDDPFRPLEEQGAIATNRWLVAQNQLTDAYLQTSGWHGEILERLTTLSNVPRQSAPWRRGGHYFQLVNDGLENQDRLVCRASLKDAVRVVIDPNLGSSEGTRALVGTYPSPDGKVLAALWSEGGSDWSEIRLHDLADGRELADHLRWVKFSSVAWDRQGSGFFYSRFAAPTAGKELQSVNHFMKVYYHRLGTTQDDDRLIFERPEDGTINTTAQVTEDGRFLVLTGWRGASPQASVQVMELASGQVASAAKAVVPEFAANFGLVGNDGDELYFQTTFAAERGRLVRINAKQGFDSLTTVIPEASDTLEQICAARGTFVARYLNHAAAKLSLFSRDGKALRELELPGLGAVVMTKPEGESDELFYTFEALTTPSTVYRVALPSGATELFYQPPTAFKPDDYTTSRAFCVSPDGTKVPLFIAHRRDLVKDGETPTLLYGYGGFNLPVLPWFRVSRMTWMELGGIYVSACLRGGNEYGDAWHQAGIRDRKQNVFDDFMAAARWLCSEGYTSPKRLAINGGSNGGLLVGAVITQCPELVGAAVAAVGVFDMLRFHKFTVGWGWTNDYGDPDVPADAAFLRRYSPLHNVKAGEHYPALLLTTGDHDDRVVPCHSYKFAATLQAAQAGDAPILLRVETNTGHGQGKPTGKLLAESADIFTFLCQALSVPWRRRAER